MGNRTHDIEEITSVGSEPKPLKSGLLRRNPGWTSQNKGLKIYSRFFQETVARHLFGALAFVWRDHERRRIGQL
jgi:hypothetical protein